MGSDTAVIYCRVSDPSKRETAKELEQQEQECRKYAAEHGITVLRAIRDSYTGMELTGRERLWDAVDDIKTGRANIILVYAYDRITREGATAIFAVQYEVETKYGGRLVSVTEPVPDGELGELYRAFAAVAAKKDRINIVRKFRRGKEYRAAQGHLSGAPNPMYGYRWADNRTRYEEDEDSAAVVRRIFTLAARGMSLRKIARLLNEEHILTPSAYAARNGNAGRRIIAPLWALETVRRTMREKAYTGQAAAFRYVKTTEYAKDKHTGIVGKHKTKALRAEGDAEAIPLPEATWPALVDVATYNAVQERLGRDGANTREGLRNLKHTEAYLLRGGYIYCGVCGAKMTGAKRAYGEGYVYRCSRAPLAVNAAELACAGKGQTVSTRLMDTAAWEAAKYALEHTENLRTALYARLEDGAQEDHAARYLSNLEAAITEKQGQRDRLVKRLALTEDEDTTRLLMREVDGLSVDIREAEKKRAEQRAVVASHEERRTWAEHIMARIMELAQPMTDGGPRGAVVWPDGNAVVTTPEGVAEVSRLDLLSYGEKRQALYLLGLRVRVYPTEHEYTRTQGKRWEIVMDLAGAGGDIVTGTSTSS